MQLRMLFLLIMLTVCQPNHFITALGTSEFMQVSPFSSTVTKGHFSWDPFLNVWKHLLFTGDGFAGARSIDSAMLSLKHKMLLQMAPWPRQSIWLVASWIQCSLQETLEKLFFPSCLSCMRRALLRANLHTSIFRTFAPHPKVASVSSGIKASATLWKNRKGHVCLLFFHEWENPEVLRGYLYSRNALLILMILQNKYSTAVTVGMYATTNKTNKSIGERKT